MKNNYVFNSIDISKIASHKYEVKKRVKIKNKKNQKIRKHKRIPVQYKVYIKSKWWVKRKNLFYKQNSKKCQACDSTKFIDLHHLLYENLGSEKDEHLVALCRECHEEYHNKYGVYRNMINDTNQFIIEKRELLDFPIISL